MGNSDHGTTYKGRRGRWGTPTMALNTRMQHREKTDTESHMLEGGGPGRQEESGWLYIA